MTGEKENINRLAEECGAFCNGWENEVPTACGFMVDKLLIFTQRVRDQHDAELLGVALNLLIVIFVAGWFTFCFYHPFSPSPLLGEIYSLTIIFGVLALSLIAVITRFRNGEFDWKRIKRGIAALALVLALLCYGDAAIVWVKQNPEHATAAGVASLLVFIVLRLTKQRPIRLKPIFNRPEFIGISADGVVKGCDVDMEEKTK